MICHVLYLTYTYHLFYLHFKADKFAFVLNVFEYYSKATRTGLV